VFITKLFQHGDNCAIRSGFTNFRRSGDLGGDYSPVRSSDLSGNYGRDSSSNLAGSDHGTDERRYFCAWGHFDRSGGGSRNQPAGYRRLSNTGGARGEYHLLRLG
jgi:hypothetical protein